MTWYIYRLEMSQLLSPHLFLTIFYLAPITRMWSFRVLPICTITANSRETRGTWCNPIKGFITVQKPFLVFSQDELFTFSAAYRLWGFGTGAPLPLGHGFTQFKKSDFCPKIQFWQNFTFRHIWIFAQKLEDILEYFILKCIK